MGTEDVGGIQGISSDLLAFTGRRFVLFTTFSKKTPKTPKGELAVARARLADFLAAEVSTMTRSRPFEGISRETDALTQSMQQLTGRWSLNSKSRRRSFACAQNKDYRKKSLLKRCTPASPISRAWNAPTAIPLYISSSASLRRLTLSLRLDLSRSNCPARSYQLQALHREVAASLLAPAGRSGRSWRAPCCQ